MPSEVEVWMNVRKYFPQYCGTLGFGRQGLSVTMPIHRHEERAGMFIPNWAVSTVFAGFVFLAGCTVTYFHNQSSVEQRLGSLDMRLGSLEKAMESMALKSQVGRGVNVDQLQRLQEQLEEISTNLRAAEQLRKRQ